MCIHGSRAVGDAASGVRDTTMIKGVRVRKGLFAAVGAAGFLLGIVALAEAPAAQTQASDPQAANISPQRALLDQYCVTCHNEPIVNGTAGSGPGRSISCACSA